MSLVASAAFFSLVASAVGFYTVHSVLCAQLPSSSSCWRVFLPACSAAPREGRERREVAGLSEGEAEAEAEVEAERAGEGVLEM